jgi:uracil-DNA glycosylase family 4
MRVELPTIQRRVVRCRRCPELRSYCADVAKKKRSSYADWTYWGRPVPAFGDESARMLIVGLAPAAHGANRTGRMFTGDRSGDFLYAALHRAGFANQAEATDRDDGLELTGVYITASLRCAPPANRPTSTQLAQCRPFLVDEIRRMRPAVTLCLGGIGWTSALAALRELDQPIPRPRPPFGHGREVEIGFTRLLGSYHVSQQNTFTGRLTPAMLDGVLARARRLLG